MARKTKVARPSRPPPPVAQTDYASWKTRAASELERLHDVPAATLPERVWKRLYIQNMTPEEAAKAAEVYRYNTRRPGFRLHR